MTTETPIASTTVRWASAACDPAFPGQDWSRHIEERCAGGDRTAGWSGIGGRGEGATPEDALSPGAARGKDSGYLDFDTSFNRHDAEGAAALYTTDADQRVTSQRVSSGSFLR